jgi:uncharacterized protein (TIGR02145 family)
MKNEILLWVSLAFFSFTRQAQTVTDYDGNVYDIVAIGNQQWMKQNLKVTHFRNGIIIPNVAGNSSWANLTTAARCYYNNDSVAYDSVYGVLYNWYTVNNANNLCPEGWHVPSDAEWTAVETFLGGSSTAGGMMKEAGTLHWKSPNTGATNESGFTGLPGGMLGVNYTFQTLNENGLWWTSTANNSTSAWSRYFWYLFAGVDRNPTPKTIALSVRCLKDIDVGTGEIDHKEKINFYPNPAANKIYIECPENQYINVKIYCPSGEIYSERALNGTRNEIDISHLPTGIYILIFTGDGWIHQEKLIKE